MAETVTDLGPLVRDYVRSHKALCSLLRSPTPLGGLGEWIALKRYGGTLARKGCKGYDVVAADARLIQAKARTADSPQFEHEQDALKFDVSLCLWFERDLMAIRGAWELRPETVERFFEARKNQYIPRIAHLRRGGA